MHLKTLFGVYNKNMLKTAISHYWTNVSKTRSDYKLSCFETQLVTVLKMKDLSCRTGVKATVPGYFRPSKNWDILGNDKFQNQVCAIELKSINNKSFRKNVNNRLEEAIGCGVDALWKNPSLSIGYIVVCETEYAEAYERFHKLMDIYDAVLIVSTTCLETYESSCTIDTFVNKILAKRDREQLFN